MKKNVTLAVFLFVVFTAFSSLSYAQTLSTWTPKSSFGGIGRAGAVSFSIGTKGYLGTGYGNGKIPRTDFWEYDESTDTWSQKADFGGVARTFAVGFSIDSLGYIGTGLGGADTIDGTVAKDFWAFSPSLNTWTKKADFDGLERYGSAGFSIGSKGYIGTGDNGDSLTPSFNDFWEYDPTIDLWTKKADFPGAGRVFATGLNIGNKGYLGLGNTGVSLTTDFYEYDPVTDTWTVRASFGGPGRINAFGYGNSTNGYIGLGSIGTITKMKDFWEYIPVLDKWNQKADFSGVSRSQAAGFNIGDMFYVGTGENGVNYLIDFWVFNSTCILAAITSEPINQSITYGTSTSFTVTATDAVSYQWQEDAGIGFVDIIDGGIYSDATTNTLNISMPTIDMTGFKYRCVITGPCLPVATSDGNTTLTVSALDVFITPDAGQTKEYGSADPVPFTYTISPSLIGTDTISGLMDRSAGEDAGDYAFALGTLGAGINYNLIVATAPTFSITPVALTITAEDKEKCYDGAIYSDGYTVSYNGFINSEDEGILGGTLVFGGTSDTATIAGNYSIDPSGLTSSNYSINYINGTMVIKPSPVTPVIIRSGDTLISSAPNGNQWFLDGAEIIGSTDQKYLATVNGVYYSIVTDNGCSSFQSNSISVLDVSIKELGKELIDIYPNPSNDKFSIKVKTGTNEVYDIEIYNNLGILVWKQNNIVLNENNIQLVELKDPTSGLYTVVLRDKVNSIAKRVIFAK